MQLDDGCATNITKKKGKGKHCSFRGIEILQFSKQWGECSVYIQQRSSLTRHCRIPGVMHQQLFTY